MHIGILQAGHTPEHIIPSRGDMDAMFRRLLDGHGFDFTSWDVENMVFPPDVHAADGWLVTGSKHGVYEDHAFIAPLERFVRDAHDADVPLVGICFGHQIVAKALGGEVVKHPDGWVIGRHAYRTGDGEELMLNAWHQDQVVRPPNGARVIATSAYCENAILAYGDRIYTIQPHPEFTPDLIGQYVAERRGTGTYPDDRMKGAEAALQLPVDNARIGASIAEFFLNRSVDV